MQAGDRRYEAEPQSVALRGPAPFQAVETFEDILSLSFRNAGPVIDDANYSAQRRLSCLDAYTPSVRPIL